MNKGYVTLIGFLLFLIGAVSLILGLVGLNLNFLGFLKSFSPIFSLLFKIVLLVTGLLVMYISKGGLNDDE